MGGHGTVHGVSETPNDTAATDPGPPEVSVEIAGEPTPELLDAINHLVPQLSRSAPPLTEAQLAEIVTSPASSLLVARIDGRIVGSLTLIVFRIPTAPRAWIEDVVVDESVRGAGVGAALNRAVLTEAQRLGVKTVDLTSRPSREAARRLYERLGFEVRETAVYRYVPVR